jgi:hypothetical protein
MAKCTEEVADHLGANRLGGGGRRVKPGVPAGFGR